MLTTNAIVLNSFLFIYFSHLKNRERCQNQIQIIFIYFNAFIRIQLLIKWKKYKKMKEKAIAQLKIGMCIQFTIFDS